MYYIYIYIEPVLSISTEVLYLVKIASFPLLQCLCISPTFELAVQTGKVIEQMGKYYPEVKLAYAIRGNRGNYILIIALVPASNTLLPSRGMRCNG